MAKVRRQIVNAVARQRRDHEGLGEFEPLIGLLRQRKKLFTRYQVDLVQHQNFGVIDCRQFGQDHVRLVVDTGAGIQQHADEIGVMCAAPRGRDHGTVEPSLRRKDSGRIDENDLCIVFDHDAADQRARRLHLLRDDGDLRSDQRVDQRRLADIRRTDQRDEAAPRLAG